MSDDQLTLIETFCAKIRPILDQADFDTRRQIIELLDVRGKIAFENGEKVIYLKCLITEQQPLYPVRTSHWRSKHNRPKYLVVARLVVPVYGDFARVTQHQYAFLSTR